jgi:hypothetical protein
VFIKLTGNAQASLPLSNGASLAFKNSSGSLFYQKFHFLMKRVISGCAHGYFLSASGRNWLSNLRSGQNLSAGTFGSVAGNPYYGVLFAGTDGRFAPPLEVLLVSDSISVTARNTAGREYRRNAIMMVGLVILLKITLGAMWATLS